MNSSRDKRALALVSILLLLSTLLAWRLAGQPFTPSSTAQDVASISAPIEPGQRPITAKPPAGPDTEAEATVTTTESEEQGRSAAEIDTEGAGRQRLDQVWEAPAEDVPAMAERLLAEMLDGDAQAAMLLQLLRIRCLEAEPHVSRTMEERVAAKRVIHDWWHPDVREDEDNDWDDPMAAFATDEKNRANLERWDAACRQVSTLFSPAFREQMDAMAQQGHVVARFLYAMWPPQFLPMSERTVSLSEHLEWEEKAYRYSAQNLQEGELLGYLAFQWAYEGYSFGPRDEFIRNAFWTAAVVCGYDGLSFQDFQEVADVIKGKPAFLVDWDAEKEKLRVTAEALASYCR